MKKYILSAMALMLFAACGKKAPVVTGPFAAFQGSWLQDSCHVDSGYTKYTMDINAEKVVIKQFVASADCLTFDETAPTKISNGTLVQANNKIILTSPDYVDNEVKIDGNQLIAITASNVPYSYSKR